MGDAGHGIVHLALVGSGILELDRVPARAAAGEVALAIEDVIAARAGDGEPRLAPPLVRDPLAVAVAQLVHVGAQAIAAGDALLRRHPRRAVGRHEAPAGIARLDRRRLPT